MGCLEDEVASKRELHLGEVLIVSSGIGGVLKLFGHSHLFGALEVATKGQCLEDWRKRWMRWRLLSSPRKRRSPKASCLGQNQRKVLSCLNSGLLSIQAVAGSRFLLVGVSAYLPPEFLTLEPY